MKKYLFAFLTGFSILILSFNPSYSQVPRIINYQASLMDADSKPINGTIDVTFSIYSNETSGIPLWTESQTIECSNGFINTYLGQIIPLNLPFDVQYWIEVKIGNSAYPRTRLTSSPYTMHALLASKADTADLAITVVDGAITQSKLDTGVKVQPLGPAGGGLTGQYPNPALNSDSVLSIVGNNFFRRDETLQGDLTGVITSPVVAKIQSVGVSPTAPNLNETFIYDGTEWKPSLINPSSLFSNLPAEGQFLSINNGIFTWSPVVVAGFVIDQVTPFATFVGYQAGNVNTGQYNTFVGYQAGFNNTTGWENTAFGSEALMNNTTGQSNAAVGRMALFSNTTGSDNTSVGEAALLYNTTGSANTAMGFGSLLSNTTADNNTAYGYSSLLINSTGASNTAIGADAMHDNTTSSFNTALGAKSLYSNTTGMSNVAIGYQSLTANTTGMSNVAIGYQALTANTTGMTNVAIGYQALTANTTGIDNTSVGFGALYQNSTGYCNTAMGFGSLNGNTTADHNTAYGYSSLLNNSTGVNNNAVGSDAMHDNTTGSFNTAVGASALLSNTTANENTALGIDAGFYNQTGFGNVFIGSHTGQGSNLYTASSKNTIVGAQGGYNLVSNQSGSVFIGFQAGYNEAGSNKLYIANSNVNPPLIGGDFSTRRVGINTNAPSGALDVVSTTGAFIVPRMSTNQRNALTPINGMIIFNTSTLQFNFYENGAWVLK